MSLLCLTEGAPAHSLHKHLPETFQKEGCLNNGFWGAFYFAFFFFPPLKKRKWICGKFSHQEQVYFAKMPQRGWSEEAGCKMKKKCWKYSFKTFCINHTSETVINQCFPWLQKVVALHCYANLFVTIIARLYLHNNWIFLLNLTDKGKERKNHNQHCVTKW